MKILEYVGLDTTQVKAQYEKVCSAIERDDFRQADVKKLANLTHGNFYRAKLDYANRLLFTLVRHGGNTYALMLEVIEQHAYDKSRFLRGASIDDNKIPAIDVATANAEAAEIRYIHPHRRDIHLLDKVISFDDAQETIYRLPPPVIVVGSAGSGKTALTLEKLKHAEGEVLYVTHSAYLAKAPVTSIMATVSSTAGRRPISCRCAPLSKACACQPVVRPAGANSHLGLPVSSRCLKAWMPTRRLRKSVA